MWRLLARLDVATILILVVLLLAALGSCFPQSPPTVAAGAEQLVQWQEWVRARYGTLTDALNVIGAFRWFRSPLFWAPWGLLALATLVCTLNRWRGLWRRVFHRPLRCSDATFDGAPRRAELNASSPVELVAVVREGLERRGFRVRSETDADAVYVRGDRHGWAPLATVVTHLAVLLLLAGVLVSGLSRRREEFTVRPGETVPVRTRGESDLQLRSEGVTVTRYGDGSVAGYEAEVVVIVDGREARRGTIRLNQPLIYRDIGLYLQAYSEAPEGHRATLLAVHDPGYVLVIAAGVLILLGLTVSLNFPHCCVRVRIESAGTVRLAERADRRAWDFRLEFAALVSEVKKAAGR